MNFITIEGFESLTAQQVLEISVRHVVKNGRPSVRATNPHICVYGGIGCAAAPFIRPEKRDRHEGQGWGSLLTHGDVPSRNGILIGKLQGCHDSAAGDVARGERPEGSFLQGFIERVLTIPHAARWAEELDFTFIDSLEGVPRG